MDIPRLAQLSVRTPQGEIPFRVFDTSAGQSLATDVLEGRTYPRLNFLQDVRTILDVGANVGAAALFFALHYPQALVFAFEPYPQAYQLLVQNLSAFGRVRTFAFGLLDRDVRVPLYLSRVDPATNSISVSGLNSTQSEEVVLRKASTVVEELQIREIDILKIDTEGCEVPILRLWRPFCRSSGFCIWNTTTTRIAVGSTGCWVTRTCCAPPRSCTRIAASCATPTAAACPPSTCASRTRPNSCPPAGEMGWWLVERCKWGRGSWMSRTGKIAGAHSVDPEPRRQFPSLDGRRRRSQALQRIVEGADVGHGHPEDQRDQQPGHQQPHRHGGGHRQGPGRRLGAGAIVLGHLFQCFGMRARNLRRLQLVQELLRE